MFERFTERARQVVILAKDEAFSMNSATVSSEHLLLGLLREGEGLAARVLEELDCSFDTVRRYVRQKYQHNDPLDRDDFYGSEIQFTVTAKDVLEKALREALSLGHNYIGTEHILLGLLRVDCDGRWTLLDETDSTEDEIRNEVIRVLSSPRKKAEEQEPVEDDGVDVEFNGVVYVTLGEGPASDDFEDGLYNEVMDLRNAILMALGWMTVDDHYMAFETLVAAVRPYAD